MTVLAVATSAGPAAGADVVAGRAVVVGATGAAACFTCHGLDGAGDGSGGFPRLTGQSAFYLYKQLVDYASGARPNDVMTPIARALDDRQMADVAAYYAAMAAPYAAVPDGDPERLALGRRIAQSGKPAAEVTACVYCHGRDGRGAPPLFPYLAGQYAPYTELQLRLWQQNVRRSDVMGVMRDIAARLSAAEIRAVAHYFETVRPQGDDDG